MLVAAFRSFANAALKEIFRYVLKPKKHFSTGCVLRELHTAKGKVDCGMYYKMVNHHLETLLYKSLTLLILREITEYYEWKLVDRLTDRERQTDRLMDG